MDESNEPLKRCSCCGEEKPLSEFYRKRRTKDGLTSHCKACIKVEAHERYLRNKDRMRERLQEWRRANPDKVKAQRERQKKNNPECRKAIERRYRQRHPEKLYEKGRKYREEHREYFRAKCAERKALKMSVSDGTVTQEYLEGLYEQQRHLCVYCGRDLDEVGRHLDHIVPLSRGGLHVASNVQWTCPTCNLSKGTKLESEWDRGLITEVRDS